MSKYLLLKYEPRNQTFDDRKKNVLLVDYIERCLYQQGTFETCAEARMGAEEDFRTLADRSFPGVYKILEPLDLMVVDGRVYKVVDTIEVETELKISSKSQAEDAQVKPTLEETIVNVLVKDEDVSMDH